MAHSIALVAVPASIRIYTQAMQPARKNNGV
jgi:hypothetical protein